MRTKKNSDSLSSLLSNEAVSNEISSNRMWKKESLPSILIIGKPNVGKSTLFNRLLHKRRAITEGKPGVTRDLIKEVVILKEKPILLVDTAGFMPKIEKNRYDDIERLAKEKTLSEIKKAQKLVLLLDATSFTSEDEVFIDLLRPFSDKLVVVVNKTEGGRYKNEACNFLQKGFKHIIFISAEHGENIDELVDAMLKDLDFSSITPKECNEGIKIAIVGKPNTGKSSLFNYLLKNDVSIVSDVAGTTRDAIKDEFYYKNRLFSIEDTAGLRRKANIKESVEYYSTMRAIDSIEKADVALHLIDAGEGISEQDKKISFVAVSKGIPVIFVLTKCDLLDSKKQKTCEKNIRIMFAKMNYAPIIAISSKTGYGIGGLLDMAFSVNEQLNRKIETSALNMALKDWLHSSPPPSKPSVSFTFKYIVQKSVHPVEFLLFSNKPSNVSEGYIRYIQNKIRKDLGFSYIPILLSVKKSRVKWQER